MGNVKNISYKNQAETTWNWVGTASGGGSISYNNDIVFCITVRFPIQIITLQNVIDAYGEPSHLYAWAGPPTDNADYTVYALGVEWIPQGFALEWLSSPNNTQKPYFGLDWKDFHLTFFKPSLEGFSEAYRNPQVGDALIPWRGMLSFDDYCVGSRCN